MALEQLGYRGWTGTLRPPWMACWPIVRSGVWLVLRRKIFWVFLAAGLLRFLRLFAIIYIKAEYSATNPRLARFLAAFEVTGTGGAYHEFMFGQGVVTMLLLAFAGSQLVGGDYDQGGLSFYLSRRLGRRQYVVGKLLAIGCLVLLITTVPALVLFTECGLLSGSLDYFLENPQIVLGILGYGAVMATALSVLLAAIASWLQRAVPLVVTWLCVLALLPVLGEGLRRVTSNRSWDLLSFWIDLRLLGRWCFGSLNEKRDELQLAPWAAWIVLAACAISFVAFLRRVRAVEVVG